MVVLRVPLRDLLYSRLTLSYCHWVTAVHFSVGNQSQSHQSVKYFPSLPVDTEGRRAQGGQVEGLAKTLGTVKALCPECLFQWEQNLSPSMMEAVQCNQPSTRYDGWSPWEMVPYWGLSIDLCCWRIGHSAIVGRSSCFWAHVWPSSLPDHFVYESVGQWQEWLGREADW